MDSELLKTLILLSLASFTGNYWSLSGTVIGKNSNNPLSLKTKSLLSALTAFHRTPVQQDIVVDQATPPESRLALVNEGFMGPIP